MPDNPSSGAPTTNPHVWAVWQLARLHQTLMDKIGTATMEGTIPQLGQISINAVKTISEISDRAPNFASTFTAAALDATADT